MNKIVNWTLGSFFRSIGRIIAYVVIGGAVAFLLSNNGFRITDLLGIQSVKADTLYNSAWTTYYTDSSKTNALPSSSNLYQYLEFQSNSNNITGQNIYFNSTIQKNDNFDYIIIPFLITGKSYAASSFPTTNYNCSYHEVVSGSPAQYYYIPYSCSYVESDSTQRLPIDINYSFSVTLITDGGGLSNCVIENESIKCYLQPGYTYTGFTFYYNATDVNSTSPLRLHFQHVMGYHKDSSNAIVEEQKETTQAIEQGTNQTTQAIEQGTNQTISTITDETSPDVNGTIDSDTLVGYLPAGPLDSVLNLPLSILQNLVNKLTGVCSPIVINIPFLVNKQLTIPCIDTIFGSIPGLNVGLSAVFGIIAGLMLYNYLIYLYNWIDDITSLKHARPRLFGARSDAENWGGN